MRRYLFVAAGVLLFLLSLFLLVEALGVSPFADPVPWLAGRGALGAALGVGLLVADVLLPVPSSLVMIANGAAFGVLGGTLLSLAGGLGAALFGFAIGRRGGPLLERLVPPEERARVGRVVERWGALAVVVTRPVPLLAETTAIMVGATGVGPGRVALAALAGSLPPAFLYALTGAAAGTFRSGALMFALVILAAALFWLSGRWLAPRLAARTTRAAAPAADEGD